jgi:hypothetical protein
VTEIRGQLGNDPLLEKVPNLFKELNLHEEENAR